MSDGNNKSLSELLENLMQTMEEKGISASEHIPKEFIQYVEDIEDDCTLSPIENYKKAYKQRRPGRCIKALKSMYFLSENNFKSTFLKSGCLKNPFGHSFTDDDYELTMVVLLNALRNAKENDCDDSFKEIILEFLSYTESLHKNNQANLARLSDNEFDSYPLVEQLLMMCIFIQDQTRMIHKKVASQNSHLHVFSGMEAAVTTEPMDFFPEQNISIVSNYEGIVEYLNNIIRFSFYSKKEELKAKKHKVPDNVHPFQIPSFRDIVNISMQRMSLMELEENFRYSNWEIQSAQLLDGTPAVLFLPHDDKQYLAHLVAGTRRRYKITSNLLFYANELEQGAKAIAELSKSLDIEHVENWVIDKKLYDIAKQSAHPMIEISLKDMIPLIRNTKINKDKIIEILSGYEFLLILSEAYIKKVYNSFNANEYSKYQALTPIMSFDFLATRYAKLYSCKIEKARNILGYYVFDDKIKINDGDIFTRPLIRISKSQVIFCQSLIGQMNIPRNIEKLVRMYGANIAESGPLFEQYLRKEMKVCPFAEINPGALSFQAFDGKEVEFDFLATFDNHLLLFELKACTTPYGAAELNACRNSIKEGVDQVVRRRSIVVQDWNKIKQLAKIELPDQPFSPDKIISAVCTNIFDFTGTMIKGTPIIDCSSLLKYFIDPEVEYFLFSREGGHLIKRESLWVDGKPNAREFIDYLSNPAPNNKIVPCYTKEQIGIPTLSEGYPVAFDYYNLTKDPFSLSDTDDGILSL